MRTLKVVPISNLSPSSFKQGEDKLLEINVSPDEGNALSIAEDGLLAVNAERSSSVVKRTILGPFQRQIKHTLPDNIELEFKVMRWTYDGYGAPLQMRLYNPNELNGFVISVSRGSGRPTQYFDPGFEGEVVTALNEVDRLIISVHRAESDPSLSQHILYEIGGSILDGITDTAIVWIDETNWKAVDQSSMPPAST